MGAYPPPTQQATPIPTSINKRTLFTLILILTIDLISFTTILPLFPSIIDFYARRTPSANSSSGVDGLYVAFESTVHRLQSSLGVPDIERYSNVFIGGILGSLFSLLQYISSPALGALSDSIGRKPVLLLSIVGSLIAYWLWSVADTFALFVLSRMVGGLSKASVSISIAIVSDVCPPRQRGLGMAFVGVAFSLAFIVGPIIGAYFAASARQLSPSHQWNPAPAHFAISMTLLELTLTLLLLPETLSGRVGGGEGMVGNGISSTMNYISPRALLRFDALFPSAPSPSTSHTPSPSLFRLRRLGLIYFSYLLIYSALEFTLSFLTHLRFGFTSMQQGQMYLFSGLLMVAIQGGYVRRIPAHQYRRGALMGLACIIPAYLLASVAYTPPLLYAALALYSVASAMVVPCLTTLVAGECEEDRRGTCLGIFRSIGASARAFGPLLGAGMFWLLGPCACYAVGAALLLIPFEMMRRTKQGVVEAREKGE